MSEGTDGHKRAPSKTADRKAAARLAAAGSTRNETAEALGIHPRTVNKWQEDPEYIEEFDAVMKATREKVCRGLIGLATKCIRTLDEALEDPDSKAVQRGYIALAVLERIGAPSIKQIDWSTVTGNPNDASPDTVVRVFEVPRGPRRR